MNIKNKINMLKDIYHIYDDFASTLNLACQRYCATCCTRNVTLTSLEGYHLIQYLISNNQHELLEKIRKKANGKRYQPQISTNTFAEMCVRGEDIPEEQSEPAWGSCPLLTNNECPVYPARPFGCRCFVSDQNCAEQGTASVDPFVLTVNNVFLQYIEHIDGNGYFGNFTDMLLALESEDVCQCYENNTMKYAPGLVSNHPISILMVPPEHRTRIRPILEALAHSLAQHSHHVD